MFKMIKNFYDKYPLILFGWVLLLISLFLPAFSSEKGVIFGLQAAIIGGVYAVQLIVVDLFVVKGLIMPIDESGEFFASSGGEYLLWFIIYLAIIISAFSNILFLSSPIIINKVKNKKIHRFYSVLLWVAVLCSIVSGLYVVLGFHDIQFGFFVWVVSLILIALGFQGFYYKIK